MNHLRHPQLCFAVVFQDKTTANIIYIIDVIVSSFINATRLETVLFISVSQYSLLSFKNDYNPLCSFLLLARAFLKRTVWR